MAGPVLRIAVRKFGPFEDAVRLQFADFCRSERIDATLEFDSLDLIPLRDALFGTGDGLRSGRYDVAFLNTDWLAEGVAEGKVRDLSLLMRERPVEGYPHGWSPSLSSLPHINGRVYGLPYHDGPMCLIYRNDLITQPPATWDDFRAASTRASDWAGGRYGTVVAGFADGHNTVYDFCIQVWTRGGELLDSTGRPSLDTSAAREGLAFYRSLLRDPATYPDAGKIDSVKSGELFMSGQVALMTNWFGFAAMCQTLDTSAVRGKIGIAPIPAGSGGRNASLNVYWFLSVAAGSTQPELAYRFVRHCMRPEMDKALTLAGGVGCRFSTWADGEINAAIPFFRQLPALHENARSFPVDVRFHHLTHVIEAAVLRAASTDDSINSILADAQQQAMDSWEEGQT